MKQPYAFTSAFATAPEAPARKAAAPMRGHNVKMDAFLRRVNGSPRYDIASIEARIDKTLEQGKKQA